MGMFDEIFPDAGIPDVWWSMTCLTEVVLNKILRRGKNSIIVLFYLLLISCHTDSGPAENPEPLHQMEILVEEAIPVHAFDLIKPIRYICPDTGYLLSIVNTRKILRNFDQIAFLQNAPGVSDFVIYDQDGNLISDLNGMHSGPENFFHASDFQADETEGNYKILVRNPMRLVTVSKEGHPLEESLLPFTDTYFEFWINHDAYLFYADNVLLVGDYNLMMTDRQFRIRQQFDQIQPIQYQTSTMDQDKMNYDPEGKCFLYRPSLIYDSIYEVSWEGDYLPFGNIHKSGGFTDQELEKISRAPFPFQEYKDLFRKRNIKPYPILNIYPWKDFLFIPYGGYLAVYSVSRRKTLVFEIVSEEMKLFNLRFSDGIFFLVQDAYSMLQNREPFLSRESSYPEKVRSHLDYLEGLEPHDNITLIDFIWEIDFIESYFD